MWQIQLCCTDFSGSSVDTQGSYGCLKTLKVLEFEMCKIKPLKVLDFIPESLKVLGFHLLRLVRTMNLLCH